MKQIIIHIKSTYIVSGLIFFSFFNFFLVFLVFKLILNNSLNTMNNSYHLIHTRTYDISTYILYDIGNWRLKKMDEALESTGTGTVPYGTGI